MRLANSFAVLVSGGLPVTIGPGIRENFEDLDGLIIGGGVDVESRLYGVDATDEAIFDPARDSLELKGLDWADRGDRPVLGICRGSQLMNVHRGGSLITNLEEQYANYRNRRSILPCKTIDVRDGTRLAAIVKPGRLRINALHRQAVDRIGDTLTVTAREDNGIVQAIEQPDHSFRIGVQWHPELMSWHPRHLRLFRALVSAAAGLLQERSEAREQPDAPSLGRVSSGARGGG